MSDETTKSRCVFRECNGYAETRGLCARHYGPAAKSVKAGETSWEELILLGLAKGTLGNQAASDFHNALAAAREKAKQS